MNNSLITTQLGKNIFKDLLRSLALGGTIFGVLLGICIETNQPTLIIFLIGLVSFLMFIFNFLRHLNQRISYIREIDDYTKKLENGDLSYRIPLRGDDELRQLSKSINAMTAELKHQIQIEEETKETNKTLITNISHDIRTPLTSILGYLTLAKNSELDEETRLKYINIAYSKAESLQNISSEFFEYSLLASGRETYHFNKVDIVDIFHHFVKDNTYLLDSYGFEIITHCYEEMPILVNVDLEKMNRVFENIISNIIKYASNKQPVYVSMEKKEFNIVISIQNRIAQYDITKESHRLGLAIIQKIVDTHKGRLIIRNDGDYYLIQIILPIYDQ